uniref:Uncharacterized protein n=1 Tax=Glossina palpalis gambiensis TaxID=67801 RepID=A0A1B0ATU0_9MUSC
MAKVIWIFIITTAVSLTLTLAFAKNVTIINVKSSESYVHHTLKDNPTVATKYVPYHKRTQSRKLKCFYQPRWPYVSCPNRGRSTRSKSCERCYRLPYGRILLYGVPAQCINCFQRYSYSSAFGASMYPSYYPPMIGSWPMIMNDNFGEYDDDGDFEGVEIKDDDLVDEETKCRLPDGSRSDDCTEIEGSGEDFEIDNDLRSGYKRPINDSAEKSTEPHFTLRGHSYTFNRSKYSRRDMVTDTDAQLPIKINKKLTGGIVSRCIAYMQRLILTMSSLVSNSLAVGKCPFRQESNIRLPISC